MPSADSPPRFITLSFSSGSDRPAQRSTDAEEVRVADSRHAHGAQDLTADDFDVFVVDGNRLRAVDLLDLVDQVALQLADAEDRQNVRIDRTVDERVARANALAFLHVDRDRGLTANCRADAKLSFQIRP